MYFEHIATCTVEPCDYDDLIASSQSGKRSRELGEYIDSSVPRAHRPSRPRTYSLVCQHHVLLDHGLREQDFRWEETRTALLLRSGRLLSWSKRFDEDVNFCAAKDAATLGSIGADRSCELVQLNNAYNCLFSDL